MQNNYPFDPAMFGLGTLVTIILRGSKKIPAGSPVK